MTITITPVVDDGFSYGRWTPDTVLTLLRVSWNSDYRDVCEFPSRAAFDSWINMQQHDEIDNVSNAKFQRNIRVNIPINAAMQWNYIRAVNQASHIPGESQRSYYYFIQDVVPISPNTTELLIQLDVWQTFIYDVTIGNCYVERGHIGIANTNANNNYGRDYLNVPEGLDTGGEYRIVKTARQSVMSVGNSSILVCSTTDLTQNPGSSANPTLMTATGGIVDGIPTGASFYVFPTLQDFEYFLAAYSQYPWVTQGIISVTVVPKISRYFTTPPVNAAPYITSAPAGPNGSTSTGQLYTMYVYPTAQSARNTFALSPAWRSTFMSMLPAQYQMLTKLLTYPYLVIELTTWTGQPLIVKPEAWADPDATCWEQAVMLPPAQRIAFIPYRYNADPLTSAGSTDDNAEYLDFSTTIDNFINVPVVNDMAINFLAANKNGLAYQFGNAKWDETRALRGADASYDNSSAEIRNTARQTSYANTAANAQAALAASVGANNALIDQFANAASMGLGVAAGGEGAALGTAGGLPGMAAAPITTGNRLNAGLQSADIATTARTNAGISNIETAGQIRDTNVGLARFAARGNYEQAIAAVNARVQDARLTQPSTAGQFGGDAMNFAHGNVEVSARWKFIDNSALRAVGNFWLRYGYAIHQFMQVPPSYMAMSKFTYWKMSETYFAVPPAIPEMFKQAIRGVFEKGVTVWADPSYIGVTQLSDNTPLPNINY